jgi:hypothetical protein
MGNLPSGPGQTDTAHSLSVAFASDAPAPAAPTGSPTAAIQTTQQTSLTSIDGKLTAQMGPSRSVNLFAFPMTTTSFLTDFSASAQLIADIAAGKEFVLTAEGGDVWYFFSPATSGHSVSATATGSTLGVTICDYIPSGQSTPPMIIPPGTVSVVALAANAFAILRMRRVN